MKVVSNSSPLIIMAKLKRLGLLREIFSEITIPNAVYTEVVIKGKGYEGSVEVREANWIKRTRVSGKTFSEYVQNTYNLGSGEAESIALAKESKADLLLMDERRARLVAISEGIETMGTVGILEACYERRLISDLRAVYFEMLRKGIYIGKDILNHSLKRFGLRIME